jgi:hypothetical protein
MRGRGTISIVVRQKGRKEAEGTRKTIAKKGGALISENSHFSEHVSIKVRTHFLCLD